MRSDERNAIGKIRPTSPAGEGVGGSGSGELPDRAHLVKVLGVRRMLQVPEGPRDQKVAAIAGLQSNRVARRQLLAVGVTRSMIATMITSGSLHPRRTGVYAVGSPAPVEFGHEIEALLACGDRAVLSGLSAAGFWKLIPYDDEIIDVTILGSQSGRARPGIRIHRSRSLIAKDIRIDPGFPVTSPARAALDISEILTAWEFEGAAEEGLATNTLTLSSLLNVANRSPGRRGATIVKQFVDQRIGTGKVSRSRAQRRLHKMIRDAKLPEPEVEVKINRYEADFLWREAGVAVEVDSYQWHSGRRAFERDRRKDRVFRDAGLDLTRITWEMMDSEPLAIIAGLARRIADGTRARDAA